MTSLDKFLFIDDVATTNRNSQFDNFSGLFIPMNRKVGQKRLEAILKRCSQKGATNESGPPVV